VRSVPRSTADAQVSLRSLRRMGMSGAAMTREIARDTKMSTPGFYPVSATTTTRESVHEGTRDLRFREMRRFVDPR
jgi:hypothetical protein